MTDDSEAARAEDQEAPERGGMGARGGKGPSAASAADTPGAFGDAERDQGHYDSVDETLLHRMDKGRDGPS